VARHFPRPVLNLALAILPFPAQPPIAAHSGQTGSAESFRVEPGQTRVWSGPGLGGARVGCVGPGWSMPGVNPG
jgi:hypothetical protein